MNVNIRSSKMTLSMLKGKPSTLSVPSIRFNPSDEDVEMEEPEIQNDEIKKKKNLFTSVSADHARETSDESSKMAKRSTSLDSGGGSGFDNVSLFKELKGKLTKTVEEKLRMSTGDEPEVGEILTGNKSKSPSLEMAEEAIESLLDGESPEARPLPVAKSTGRSERLKQLSTEIKNRKSRLLNRGDVAPPVQSWTMSALANRNQDDDAFEERLNTEYHERERDEDEIGRDLGASGTPPLPPPTPPVPKSDFKTQKSRPVAVKNRFEWAGYVLMVAILYLAPLPPFLTGLVTGIGLVVVFLMVHARYVAPRPRNSNEDESIELEIPEVRVRAPEVHRGWMNELRHAYDSSNYHVGATCPVLVRLEGSLLRISRPKTKVPRHATWNEGAFDVSFSDQRYYNVAGSQVVLLPVGLTRKRLWSRKYPLCILLSDLACRTGHLSVTTDDDVSTDTTVASPSEDCVYLFARTSREKEEWYWILTRAMTKQEPTSGVPLAPSSEAEQELDFYMSKWLDDDPEDNDCPSNPSREPSRECAENTKWLNALLGRIFWDFLREPAWAGLLVARIQRKLSKIKLPYFMEELSVTSLELGSHLPAIDRVCGPVYDQRGLWIDLDLSYEGKAAYTMTLETKLNLMKLKRDSDPPSPVNPAKSAAFDSDEEDSAESSTDDEGTEECGGAAEDVKLARLAASQGGGATSKKILRFVDKISQSRYFQHATEYKFMRKAMEGVSNTRLILTVELQALSGTLALNVPPPPTDRLWYGFRTNPKITLIARPKLGEREVTVGTVTEWIEKKLIQEFQKVLVMPNMDDLVIPIMTSRLTTNNPFATQGTSKNS